MHRLVAIAFISNPNNYPIINHIDGNKKNNKVDNLEWCTNQYNLKEAYRLGLIKISKEAIRKGGEARAKKLAKKICQYDLQGNFIKVWSSAHEVQRKLKINNANIIQNCKGKRNNAGGYIWKYAS